jgi:signal transduction histidine kinase
LRQGDYAARVAVSGEDEVAHLQADFNAMADELSRTLADLEVQRNTVSHLLQNRREMIASVSHELRTPVATVRAMLESILREDAPHSALTNVLPAGPSAPESAPDNATTNPFVVGPSGPLSPDLHHDLLVIDSEMARLQRIIDDLFLLARAEAGQLQLDCQPIDVAAIARRMVDALAPLAWQAGRVEVVADLPEDLPPARADAERLGQILANLLRNAIRHTDPGGIVVVALRAEPQALALEVRDTGTGIPADELPHIWERFYQGAGNRATSSDGAGLGLALVKELTEAMGGNVAVLSDVGQGSCFTVRLPRANAMPTSS